jgi:hypothetical protein
MHMLALKIADSLHDVRVLLEQVNSARRASAD